MSFQQIIARWLAAQVFQTVQNEVRREIQKEIFSNGDSKDDAPDASQRLLTCGEDSVEEKPKPPHYEIGFVFAMPMESAGIADRLVRKKTIRGNGRIFHTGLFEQIPVVLVESGVGREKAERGAEILLETFHPRRIISAGYAGGLNSSQQRFAVRIPQRIIRAADGAILDLSEPVPRIGTNSPTIEGITLLTTDSVIGSSKQKRTLGKEFGADLVDMESFAVAEVCRRREIPFLSFRIVLDTVGEELPKDIQRILKNAEIGGARLAGSLLGSLFQRPSAMIDLYTLKERALDATDRLAKQIAVELKR